MKTLLTILTLAFSISVFADDHADFAKRTSELGANLNVKYMEKAWKKRSDAWVTEAAGASDLSTLIDLVLELEDNLADKALVSTWKKDRTDWETRCREAADHTVLTELLLEMEAGILDEAFEEGWAGSVEAWTEELTALSTNIRKASEQVTLDKDTFLANFKTIWDDSYESFPSVIDGEESYQLVSDGGQKTYYNAKVALPDAYSVYITMDSEGLYEYVCYFNGGSFKENALSIMEQIQGMVDGQKEEGFVMNENVSVEYEDRKMYTFEFEGEKFIDTGKRPTCTVGVMKKDGLYLTVLRITEPVFKR